MILTRVGENRLIIKRLNRRGLLTDSIPDSFGRKNINSRDESASIFKYLFIRKEMEF